jgi:hypothetical protein
VLTKAEHELTLQTMRQALTDAAACR